jgi:hypothetical protein
MKGQHPDEYCLIVEGSYLSVNEAEHALRDPFIEDLVEQTGRFRIHNLNEMMVVPGVPLGQLGVEMIDEGVFEIFSLDPEKPLTERKAEGVASALRRQDMFDEIEVAPRLPADEDEPDEDPPAAVQSDVDSKAESDEVESEVESGEVESE